MMLCSSKSKFCRAFGRYEIGFSKLRFHLRRRKFAHPRKGRLKIDKAIALAENGAHISVSLSLSLSLSMQVQMSILAQLSTTADSTKSPCLILFGKLKWTAQRPSNGHGCLIFSTTRTSIRQQHMVASVGVREV